MLSKGFWEGLDRSGSDAIWQQTIQDWTLYETGYHGLRRKVGHEAETFLC